MSASRKFHAWVSFVTLSRLVRAACVATTLVLSSACSRDAVSVELGGVSLNVSSSAALAAIDAWRVTISGPSGTQTRSGPPGGTVEFGDLQPGSYTVLMEGLEGADVASRGQTTVTVQAGSKAVASVAPAPVLPELTVVASDANAAEVGADPGVFTISRTGTVSAALVVNVSLAGSATAVVDYSSISSPVTMSAGQRSVAVNVVPVADATTEGPESVVLALASGAGYVVGAPSSATVNIADAPAAIVLTPSALTFSAVRGANPASQNVTISNAGSGSLPGLSTGAISYGAGATGWLAVTLSTSTAPATLTLQPTTGSLATGTYTATVPVFSAAASNSPQTVMVTFTVDAPLTATVASAVVASTVNHPFATAFPSGIRPVTGSGGSGALTYAIAPALRAGLAFDASSGAITGAPTVAGSTQHTVRVTDGRGSFAEASFTLAIAPALAATAAVPSRACTQGALCAYTPVTATGGTGALSYVVVSPPALPTGLQLAGGTGAVSGTPSVSTAAVTYTVRVVDVVGASVTQNFSLTVNPPLVTTLGASTYGCTAGASCAFTAVTVAGGTAPYAYSLSPSLPAGVTLNTATGAVSGSPTAASATTSYTLTVTDAAGATSSQTFSFGVNGPLAATVVTPTIVSTVAVPFATAFPADVRPVQGSGGTGALLYAIVPALPSGLTFAPLTGAITGTPTAPTATTTYTVTISDNAGSSIARTFTLTINPPITLNAAAVQCTQNATCSATPVTVGSGGTGPYTFTVSPALPSALTYSSSGAISGTPATVQAATAYTVTVRDAVGATATAVLTVTVNPALSTTLAIPEVGCSDTGCTPASPFAPVTASSGTAPYGFAVTPALPSGFTLNPSTGTITAVASPTVAQGPINYTMTVTDATGATASRVFALSVLQTTLAVASPSCSVGTACSVTPVTRSGGKPAVTFSINGPDLAAITGVGLTFSTATGAISGTPSATLAARVIAVTASDAIGRTSTKSFTLTIGSGAPVLGVGFGLEQFASIPTGSYPRGSTTGVSAELPIRTITISAFRMQLTEVTQGQWRQVMTGTALANPSTFSTCGDTCPVESVSYEDIQQFLTRLNTQDPGKGYRLPTEAEWEYAARAGSTGDVTGSGNLLQMGWVFDNAGGTTRPVGGKLANAFGLFDVHGNVFEWVNDWFDATYYGASPATNPPGPASSPDGFRVLRGGSWYGGSYVQRLGFRGVNTPTVRDHGYGFRLARTP